MNPETHVYVLDESTGLIEEYDSKCMIQLEPPPLVRISEPPPLTPLPKMSPGDPPSPEYVDVKIKLETPLTKSKRKKRKAGPVVHCDICGKEFNSNVRLNRHREIHNESRERFACDMCPQTCSDKWTLARHKIIHNGSRPYVCVVCEKAFTTSTGLKRHLTCHDPDSRPYTCKDCPKRFPDRSSMKKHVLLHSGVKPHVCDVCEKAFTVIGDLNLHKKCHEEIKPYSCLVCGREFSRHSNLMRHTNVHILSGNEVYTCEVCKVSFQHGGTLTRHIIAAHPIKKKNIDKKNTKASKATNSEIEAAREEAKQA